MPVWKEKLDRAELGRMKNQDGLEPGLGGGRTQMVTWEDSEGETCTHYSLDVKKDSRQEFGREKQMSLGKGSTGTKHQA